LLESFEVLSQTCLDSAQLSFLDFCVSDFAFIGKFFSVEVRFEFFDLSFQVFILFELNLLLKFEFVRHGLRKELSSIAGYFSYEFEHNDSFLRAWRSVFKEILLKSSQIIFVLWESLLKLSVLELTFNEAV
jgi:hypothetical protein